MNRSLLSLVAALAALGAATPEGTSSLLERLRWNARERTATGLAELHRERTDAAVEAFDAALRTRPEDPLVRFNAGTGRLAAGRIDDAIAPLEAAARTAPEELASDAWFNLGNARLAAGDPARAVEAFTESLRRAPGRADAKRNLELALRARRTGEGRAGAQNDSAREERTDAENGGGSEEERGAGREAPSDPAESTPPSREPGSANREGESDGGKRPPESAPRDDAGSIRPHGGASGSGASSPLPEFREVPELTAEQADALLQAVENLERDERRRRARERALAAAEVDEDW